MSSNNNDTNSTIRIPPVERQCGKEALNLSYITGATGLFLGAAHLAWNNAIPLGYTVPSYLAARTGHGAALGGLYALTSCSVTTMFHTSPNVGSTIGGFMTGFAIGLHQRSLGMAVGLGTGMAFLGYMYEYNDHSLRGPIGKLSLEARNKYNMESFWKNPADSPVARALDIAERARQIE